MNTAREVLDVIDEFLSRPVQNSKFSLEQIYLWDILTALRGPDDENNVDKTRFTIPIRRTAFPKVAKMNPSLQPALFDGPDRINPVPFIGHPRDADHYLRHIAKAADALKMPIKEEESK